MDIPKGLWLTKSGARKLAASSYLAVVPHVPEEAAGSGLVLILGHRTPPTARGPPAGQYTPAQLADVRRLTAATVHPSPEGAYA
jgi:hypothetical protein